MTMLYVVIACGLLSVLYAIWATKSVLAADQGNARMQEISAAIREGAQAYLARQYTTIAIVGVVVFVLAWWLLSATAAFGFLIGAVLSGVAGFGRICARRRPPPTASPQVSISPSSRERSPAFWLPASRCLASLSITGFSQARLAMRRPAARWSMRWYRSASALR
jgi:VIT1/CCC1 family predicted Fe2+/Mn2+ transporter